MTRGRSAILLLALGATLAAAAGVWYASRGPGEAGAERPAAARFHCPMHPTMIYDRPGDCPICGMQLVPIGEEPAAPTAAGAEEEDAPGTVRLSARKQQLIGVRTSPVVREPFRRAMRAVGRVAVDETRLRHVHTKVAGYVERLHTNATGEPVRAGQPMIEFYSPELLASQQEFLVALQARGRVASSSVPGVRESAEELVRSARRRLELFDVTDEQVAELAATGQPRRSLTLLAPISGVVLRREVTEGERVEAGTTLLELADLSRVWVIASVYEYELPFVREGQRASMTLSYLPGRAFSGRVALVYPTLDPATRSAQVRLEFANPDLELRPEMFAEVELEADLGVRLAVPASAVLETGKRAVVFVDRGEGAFEPREVRIGLRLADAYEVLEGLREGERVLTSGNFLVDSESKLDAALAAMAETPAAPAHVH